MQDAVRLIQSNRPPALRLVMVQTPVRASLLQSGSAINFLDRAIVNCATVLEEAWAWGFDVDVWRAHVNPLTWPEVLRQMAIAWGLGAKRPKPKKEVKPKMGTDGEDLVADENGGLKLRLPPRFGIGTVKAAAWAVSQAQRPSAGFAPSRKQGRGEEESALCAGVGGDRPRGAEHLRDSEAHPAERAQGPADQQDARGEPCLARQPSSSLCQRLAVLV